MDCCSRTRRRSTGSTGRATAWPAPIGEPPRPPGRARRRLRRQVGRHTPILRDGTAQPREQRCDPGLRRARRALGRRHVHDQPGAVAALLVHRPRRGRDLERHRAPAFVSGVPASTIRGLQRLATTSRSGHSIAVPLIAPAGSRSSDDRPTSARSRRTTARQRDPNGVGIDGPQWVLDYCRDDGVFRFVRVEDIAYDKRSGKGNIGLHRRLGTRHARTTRTATRSHPERPDLEARVLDPDDPTDVTSLSTGRRG